MSECTHDCSSCSSNCSEAQPQSLIASPHKGSSIKKVIGVVSGKGGVGKSMVTDLLAVAFSRKGYHCAIMDADITGPSIPKAFGLTQKAEGTQDTIYPVKTKTGIDVMSINLLLENETDPVIWRGPVIAGAVKQFWTDVLWEDVDYMFVDMPPGTGDVPLTVF
ncbi:MAG: P-loop NTPase, partial [Eubacterium sp.]